jgi:hypothetical protein
MAFLAKFFKAKFWAKRRAKFQAKFGAPLKTTIIAILLLLGFAGLGGIRVIGGRSAFASQTNAAQESWRTEFDDICAKTEDAMTFSQGELTDLIRRCDNLQPRIEKLDDESRKKVFLERLRKCRGLYAYVLDAKRLDAKSKDKDKK